MKKRKKIWIDSDGKHACILTSEPRRYVNLLGWYGGWVHYVPTGAVEAILGERLPRSPLLTEIEGGKAICYWLPPEVKPPKGWEFV